MCIHGAGSADWSCFIQFIDEMRKPADYMKSLALLQGTDIVLYLVVGLVVALYVGEQAVSPALGNLSPTLARVACESCLG